MRIGHTKSNGCPEHPILGSNPVEDRYCGFVVHRDRPGLEEDTEKDRKDVVDRSMTPWLG